MLISVKNREDSFANIKFPVCVTLMVVGLVLDKICRRPVTSGHRKGERDLIGAHILDKSYPNYYHSVMH